MNVAICLAHNYPSLEKTFVLDLIRMYDCFIDWKIKSNRTDTLSVLIHGGYNLDKMRNDVTLEAMANGADIILYLDTDMSFPADTISRLLTVLEANPKYSAVSGLYVAKKDPYLAQIFTSYNAKTQRFTRPAGFPLDVPFEIVAAGAGVLMVKVDAIKKMSFPYFKFVYKGENKMFAGGMGEDLYFCHNFLKKGFKMLCDPIVSCGHYDTRPVSIANYVSKNGLNVKDGKIKITKKQLKDIDKRAAKTYKSKLDKDNYSKKGIK